MAEFYITDAGMEQLYVEGILELDPHTTLRHVPMISDEDLKELLKHKPCRA